MILGKSGRLPGPLDPEIVALAKEKGYEFTDEDPQKNYPDQLDEYRKEMQENGWESDPMMKNCLNWPCMTGSIVIINRE